MARFDDGYKTTISFADNPSVSLEEKEVTPPGIEGGGEIDTTTMQNDDYRTFSPKSLKTLTEASLSVAYEAALYNELIAMVNSNQLITVTFPDLTTVAFWGWINVFTPGAFVEGEQPTADITIIPSNVNDSGVETAPVVA